MAADAVGIEAPTGSDAFDPQGDMVKLAISLHGMVIIPVPTAAARDTVCGVLDAAGVTAGYFQRADAASGKKTEFVPDTSNPSSVITFDQRHTAWTTISSFGSGMSAGSSAPQVMLKLGIPLFQGEINGSFAAGDDKTLFTIPDGFRPSVQVIIDNLGTDNDGVIARAVISTSGVVAVDVDAASAPFTVTRLADLCAKWYVA